MRCHMGILEVDRRGNFNNGLLADGTTRNMRGDRITVRRRRTALQKTIQFFARLGSGHLASPTLVPIEGRRRSSVRAVSLYHVLVCAGKCSRLSPPDSMCTGTFY